MPFLSYIDLAFASLCLGRCLMLASISLLQIPLTRELYIWRESVADSSDRRIFFPFSRARGQRLSISSASTYLSTFLSSRRDKFPSAKKEQRRIWTFLRDFEAFRGNARGCNNSFLDEWLDQLVFLAEAEAEAHGHTGRRNFGGILDWLWSCFGSWVLMISHFMVRPWFGHSSVADRLWRAVILNLSKAISRASLLRHTFIFKI